MPPDGPRTGLRPAGQAPRSLAAAAIGAGILIHCSTRHPSEVQHPVARALGVAEGAVMVEVRRIGGGFGGRESQAARFAAVDGMAAVDAVRRIEQEPPHPGAIAVAAAVDGGCGR